jgi:hypothetical protein
MKDIKSEVKVLTAILPQVASGESVAINGFTIDRLGYEGGVYSCLVGNTSGAPTTFGVTFKVQEKSGETDWVDVSGMTYIISGETVAQQGRLSGEINIDFKGCARKTRLVATPNFNGGSSPKVEIGAVLVLGEAQVEPAL